MSMINLEQREGGVTLLTLNDPDKRNAMNDQMAAELVDAVRQLGSDPDVRALVVSGEGGSFCAGADLSRLFGDAKNQHIAEMRANLQRYYQAFLQIRDLPMVTIAAVNGPAIGAGLNLAMVCDLRVAGADAKFGATFSRIGLHPGGGCSYFLVRAMGPSRALRTLLLGETLEAQAAVDAGLADGPEDDPLATALELADRVAAVDERGLARHIKKAVRIAVDSDDFEAVLEYESWAQAASADSPQLAEWIARFKK